MVRQSKKRIKMRKLVLKRWNKSEDPLHQESSPHSDSIEPIIRFNISEKDLAEAGCSVLDLSPQTEHQVDNDIDESLGSFFPTGRRIIDINYWFKSLISHKHVELFNCSFTDMAVLKETRTGLLSTFHLECKVCKTTLNLHSEDPNSKILNLNTAIVSAVLSTGGGFSQLDEILAVANIPSLSKDMYNKEQVKLAEVIEATAWSSMEEAGKEETRIAIEKGSVDAEGFPCITVVTDGAWCKRSFRNNYNASSGVACIIGQETKKILFIGVRNKYCCICERAKILGILPNAHKCFKNWDGSSTAMESDIIVDGFMHSLEMHGLKYSKLVGDGDSSVYKKLVEVRPYGYNLIVEKIECSNHLLRNYCTNLRELSVRRYSSAGKPVNPNLRNLLSCNIKRLRCAVEYAAKYHRKNPNFNEGCQNLKKDLLNSVNHVFGQHANCSEYFCKRKHLNESNWVLQLKECGLYNDILSLLNRIVFHARSLFFNMTNNVCENYNSVIAKFVGGKRINFSKRGSYRARCFAAVLSYNTRGKFHRSLHASLTNNSPGSYTKKFLTRKSKQSKRTKKLSRPRKLFAPSDKDYGNVAEDMMCPEVFDLKKESFLKELSKTTKEIRSIEKNTVGQRNNQIWHSERLKRLTASNFGKICKLRITTSCASSVKQILYNTFSGNKSTRYGIEKEPLAIKEMEDVLKVKIEECGLFIDKEDFYLAASPDGLIGDDTIVEIKCPASANSLTPEEALISKKINFATLENKKLFLKRNHAYHYQIQGQLHITKRLYCIFVLWTPKGILYEKIERDNNFWEKNMHENLKKFYFECLLPEILNPQYPKGLPIKNPEYRNR